MLLIDWLEDYTDYVLPSVLGVLTIIAIVGAVMAGN